MSLASELESASRIIKDWVGEGLKPVESERAEGRASVCVPCPHNRHGKWWELSKNAIAAVMRMQLDAKNHAKISVSTEDKLHLCEICGCCLPLKVHVPIKHILGHTDEATLARFPDWCWIPKEQKEI